MLELAARRPPPISTASASRSLLRTGKRRRRARPLFWHFPHYTNQGGRPAGAVRDGKWKLVEHYEDGRVELFDLAEDVGEAATCAAETGADRGAAQRLQAWRASIGAQQNRPNPAGQPKPVQAALRDVRLHAVRSAPRGRGGGGKQLRPGGS